MKDVKSIVAANLTMLRKYRGLTQAELAEKFNYSDKAVCRWEHGDTLPDINILSALCDFYEITLNDLTDPECTVETVTKNDKDAVKYRVLMCLLMSMIVWLVATVWFVMSNIIFNSYYWIAFVWAVPLSCVAIMRGSRTSMPSVWRIILSSVLSWTLITACYLHLFVVFDANVWMLFFIGMPLQAIIVLWDRLKKYKATL